MDSAQSSEVDASIVSMNTDTETQPSEAMSRVSEDEPNRTVNQIITNPYTGVPHIVLRPYTGDNKCEDLIDWIDQYENLATDLNWKDSERVCKLPLYLDGTAKLWYNNWIRPRLNQGGYKTFSDIRKKMITVLLKPDYCSEYHRRMTTRKQGKDQSPTTFVIQMQALCKRVDRNMTESTILSFIREGLDSRLKPWISAQNPRTIEELLDALKFADRSAQENEAMFMEMYRNDNDHSGSDVTQMMIKKLLI